MECSGGTKISVIAYKQRSVVPMYVGQAASRPYKQRYKQQHVSTSSITSAQAAACPYKQQNNRKRSQLVINYLEFNRVDSDAKIRSISRPKAI